MSDTWEHAVRLLLGDPNQAELVRDCYFDPPIEAAADRFYGSREWDAVRQLVGPARGRALDVGAGNGIVSFALARDGWATFALEPDPSDLVGAGSIRRLALASGLNIDVLNGFGESVPTSDESFELVIARQVLHHAQDLDAFCREMWRVLKPGGMLFAYRDHVISGPEQLQAFFDQHALHRIYGGENAHPERVYREALQSAGFSVRKQWRQFEASFNFAPKSRADVAREAFAKLLPMPLAKALAGLACHPFVYPALGKALSVVDRRPGRAIAFLALKTRI